MFAGTATEDIKLSAIKIQEYEPDGTTYLQIYDPALNKLTRYYWNEDPNGEEQPDGSIPGCWCDDQADPIPEEELPTLAAGKGFWLTISSTNDDPAMTIAGALYTTDSASVTVERELLINKKDMLSNPMPGGDLLLSQISIREYEPDGTTYLQIYDPVKNVLNRYYWNEDPDGEEQPDGSIPGCWCDDQADPILEEDIPTVPAGQGFWLTTSSTNDDPAMIVPNPLYIEK